MKKKLIRFILAVLVISGFQKLFSQEPLQFIYTNQLGSVNSEQLIDMETDNDGNIVFLLNGSGSKLYYKSVAIDTGYNSYLIKMNPSGDIINHLGFKPGDDQSYVVFSKKIVQPDNNIILLGSMKGYMSFYDTTYYFDEQKGFICKINSDYLPISIEFIDITNDITVSHDMAVNKNGDIYVLGISEGSVYYGPNNDTVSIPFGTIKMAVCKYNSDFSMQWLNVFYCDGSIYSAHRISFINQQNNLVISSEMHGNELHYGNQTFQFQKDHHIFISKITSSGDLLWVKSADSDSESRFTDLCVDDNNDIYLTSGLKSNLIYDSITISPYSIWREGVILKVDENGNFQWYNQIRVLAQNFPDIFPNEIKVFGDFVFLTGKYKWDIMFENIYLESISGECDNFLAKMDAQSGEFIYAQGFYSYAPVLSGYFSFTLAEPDIIYASIPFKDEGSIGGATFSSYNNSFDVVIAKLQDMTVNIEGLIGNDKTGVFPNPGINELHISTKANCQSIRLFDHTGKIVIEKKFNTAGTKSINTRLLPAGLYIYELTDENGNTTNGKWIKKQ